MRGFNAPLSAYMEPSLMWTWLPDRLAQALVDWLVQGKFITLFAALFGIGFAIQMDRAAARHAGRRLLRPPDGGPAPHRPRARVRAVVGRHPGQLRDLRLPAPALPQPEPARRSCAGRTSSTGSCWCSSRASTSRRSSASRRRSSPAQNIQEAIDIYSRGTIAQIFALRAASGARSTRFVFFLTRILGIFLFGLYLWRQGYLRQPARTPRLVEARAAHRPAARAGGQPRRASCIDWIFHPNPMQADRSRRS